MEISGPLLPPMAFQKQLKPLVLEDPLLENAIYMCFRDSSSYWPCLAGWTILSWKPVKIQFLHQTWHIPTHPDTKAPMFGFLWCFQRIKNSSRGSGKSWGHQPARHNPLGVESRRPSQDELLHPASGWWENHPANLLEYAWIYWVTQPSEI